MLELLTEWFTQFSELTRNNPVLAGVVSLYGLGILTFFLRNVPATVWSFTLNQTTTRLVFDNTDEGHSTVLFNGFMRWFHQNHWSRYARVLRIYTGWSHNDAGRYIHQYSIGVDETPQLLFWEGMPCFVRRVQVGSNPTLQNKIIYQVIITRLGRNRGSLLRLFESFKPKEHDGDRPKHWHWRDNSWLSGGGVSARTITSVVTRPDVKQDLLHRMDWFLKNETWFSEHGIPYKLVILLTGRPGNGKTSLIRAIATHLNRDIHHIALMSHNDQTLRDAISTVEANCIIAMEDFNHPALLARNASLTVSDAPVKRQTGITEQALTLQGFLNVFDGLDTLHGQIIFMTTNVVDELDAAVIRDGRVDHVYVLDDLTDTEIREYLKNAFNVRDIHTILDEMCEFEYGPISGAKLQTLYRCHPNDLPSILMKLPVTDKRQHANDHTSRKEAIVAHTH